MNDGGRRTSAGTGGKRTAVTAGASARGEVRVKFCGISQAEDAAAINELMEKGLGPDYVGLVFWAKSRRAVVPHEAHKLRATLDGRVRTVGVFVDADVQEIACLHEQGVIDVAQLHGSEDDAFIARLRDAALGLEVWKAFEVPSGERGAEVVARANASSADLMLLDAGKGEGNAFDWSLLGALTRPFALAGGLDAHNVGEALARCSPVMVDVSSGIEVKTRSADGRTRKDVRRMQAFMRAVRGDPDAAG